MSCYIENFQYMVNAIVLVQLLSKIYLFPEISLACTESSDILKDKEASDLAEYFCSLYSC